jgi:nucleoid-associated protein YgaU
MMWPWVVELVMDNAGPGPRTHVVGPGENLDQIARRYYGTLADQYLTTLYEANHDMIVKDPNHLRPGITLVIPELE